MKEIFHCLAPCAECTGGYISEILGMRFICCCPCHAENKDITGGNSSVEVYRHKYDAALRPSTKTLSFNVCTSNNSNPSTTSAATASSKQQKKNKRQGEERIPQGAPRIAAQMRQVVHSLRDNDNNNNQEVAEAVNR